MPTSCCSCGFSRQRRDEMGTDTSWPLTGVRLFLLLRKTREWGLPPHSLGVKWPLVAYFHAFWWLSWFGWGQRVAVWCYGYKCIITGMLLKSMTIYDWEILQKNVFLYYNIILRLMYIINLVYCILSLTAMFVFDRSRTWPSAASRRT